MNTKQNCFSFAVLACLSGLFGQANAEDIQAIPEPSAAPVTAEPNEAPAIPERQQAQPFPASKISFAPLPVNIYLQQGQKPVVAVTTPCVQMEKLTHGFPPFITFETFMFQMIGNMNDSEMLPVKFEPVCT
jgi:hypothetical protein